MNKQNLKPKMKNKQTVCGAWTQDTLQQLGHSCQPCMLTSYYTKPTETKMNQMIGYRSCSAVEVKKQKKQTVEGNKREITKGWVCGESVES